MVRLRRGSLLIQMCAMEIMMAVHFSTTTITTRLCNNMLQLIAKSREGIFQKALIVLIPFSVVLKNHSTLLQYYN